VEYYSSQALILRVKDVGESDLLVFFFTADSGLRKGIAKGGRKSRKRFVNCLDHFCLSQLEYHRKKENQLFLLDSCKLIRAFEAVRTDYHLLALASYFAELAEALFPLHVEADQMFHLLVQGLELLCQGEQPEKVRVFFEGRAMAIGGYAVNLSHCCGCGRTYKGEGRAVFVPERGGISCLGCRKESKRYPGMDPESVKVLAKIQDVKKKVAPQPDFTGKTGEELKRVLDQHVLYRLGKKVKSRKYLE